LEGIENLIKLIKNTKYIIKIFYSFIYSNDFTELTNLFNNLIKCKNYGDFYKYIEKIEQIEQMIIELNGFQNYVLK
jgi:hypothetical protein